MFTSRRILKIQNIFYTTGYIMWNTLYPVHISINLVLVFFIIFSIHCIYEYAFRYAWDNCDTLANHLHRHIICICSVSRSLHIVHLIFLFFFASCFSLSLGSMRKNHQKENIFKVLISLHTCQL